MSETDEKEQGFFGSILDIIKEGAIDTVGDVVHLGRPWLISQIGLEQDANSPQPNGGPIIPAGEMDDKILGVERDIAFAGGFAVVGLFMAMMLLKD